MSNEQEEIRYSRDRSRSRDRGSEDEYDRDGRGSRNFGNEEGHSSSENFALYVSNMSIEVTNQHNILHFSYSSTFNIFNI